MNNLNMTTVDITKNISNAMATRLKTSVNFNINELLMRSISDPIWAYTNGLVSIYFNSLLSIENINDE